MRYKVEIYSDDPGEPPYEFTTATRRVALTEVERLLVMLREGDVLQVKIEKV